jgi:hypothetical protein
VAARNPRLGVTNDPDIQRALELTEPLLDPSETRSVASQIRALVLRGAEAVLAGAGSRSRLQAHLAERRRATIGHGNLADLNPPPGEPDPGDATLASDALRWARSE